MCNVIDCYIKNYAKGFCKKHYERLRVYGSVTYSKHKGYTKHPLYVVWKGIKSRCYNSNNEAYKNYGGRGIKVCNKWRYNFKKFFEWSLNSGWKKGLFIDRRNNDGNYSPQNCRFITPLESNHNQRLLRSNNKSGYRGVCYKKKAWEAQIEIDKNKIYLGRFNSSKEAALAYDRAVSDNRPKNFI